MVFFFFFYYIINNNNNTLLGDDYYHYFFLIIIIYFSSIISRIRVPLLTIIKILRLLLYSDDQTEKRRGDDYNNMYTNKQ